MNRPRRERRWLAAGLLAAQIISAPLFAQTNAAPPSPPVVGKISPVDLFRKLLAMTPAEQKDFLADKSPEHQKRILAKVREYESLKPDQRELRLRVTELHWYLSPLLTAPATNRAAQLAAIPDDERRAIEDRLREWDKLPATAQKELLDNEATLRYFTQVADGAEQNISAARRGKLEAGIADWQKLPAAQRQKLLARFNQFFDLTATEKCRALEKLSDVDRAPMEKTLAKFEKLPRAQRDASVQAFAKYAAMSLAERQDFLKNAERWRLMPPEEQQAWRELVQKLPPTLPPMPPGLKLSPAMPPLPPGMISVPPSAIATNNR